MTFRLVCLVQKSSLAPLLPSPACLLHQQSLLLLPFPSYARHRSDFPPRSAPLAEFSSKLSLRGMTLLKNVQMLQLFLFCLA